MNPEMQNFKTQYADRLHQLGDQIERIAEELKDAGNEEEYKQLYRLGNQIEHFFEGVSYKDAQSADGLNADGGKNQSTGLSEPSTSTVNHSQEAG
jgi:hypothetical protein